MLRVVGQGAVAVAAAVIGGGEGALALTCVFLVVFVGWVLVSKDRTTRLCSLVLAFRGRRHLPEVEPSSKEKASA